MPAQRKIVRSRTGDLFTRKKLTRTKSLRERGEAARQADTEPTASAAEPKIYKSQLMVKFSKPSFSIYLDYVPRDKCFKVAYIVEGEVLSWGGLGRLHTAQVHRYLCRDGV